MHRGTPGHMRLPHRLQGQKVKSQGHGAGAYCGGHLAAQLVSSTSRRQAQTSDTTVDQDLPTCLMFIHCLRSPPITLLLSCVCRPVYRCYVSLPFTRVSSIFPAKHSFYRPDFLITSPGNPNCLFRTTVNSSVCTLVHFLNSKLFPDF